MRKIVLGIGLLVAGAACSGDAPTVPAASSPAMKGMSVLPGSQIEVAAVVDKITLINCVPRTSATGGALVGPPGGTIWIGPHRITIPPGALDEKVEISGTVPADKPFEIDLQPHGLKFRKPAGLVLDMTSCLDVPAIVYLIDQYTQSPPIEATYSTLWHTIACPIWHFSGYAIALGDVGGKQSESSSQ